MTAKHCKDQRPGCGRGIDPLEDSERDMGRTARRFRHVCGRGIDPLEDSESNIPGLATIPVGIVGEGSIRWRILKVNYSRSKLALNIAWERDRSVGGF